MKKNFSYPLYLVSFLFFIYIGSNAQTSTTWKRFRHDISIGYGYNNLLTTIGEKDNVGFLRALQRSSTSASYRYQILQHFSVRGQFTQMYCRKNDKDLNIVSRENLRIDYETSMTEFGAMAEYHLFDETGRKAFSKQTGVRDRFSKLASLGISFYAGLATSYFRPQAEYLGKRVTLAPVNSNPGYVISDDSYKKVNLFFPIGVNTRLILSENWRVGVDLGYRFGVRSYINDVSSVYFDRQIDQSQLPISNLPDPYYAGSVYFGDENQALSQLSLQSGRKGYFLGLISVSYRIKTEEE